MKTRRGFLVLLCNTILCLVVLSIVTLPQVVLAYDTDIAHPNIAGLAAELYNNAQGGKLTTEEIGWIKQGAREEDMPTRWMNHFYDPIHNTGLWSGVGGKTAKTWANDPFTQNTFALGDQSWKRALYCWQNDNKQAAYIALGHVLHLVADMAVPAHTRDDAHPSGDSYEGYVKNNWFAVQKAISGKTKYSTVGDLKNAFDTLASYTNANYYSDDTIESKNYVVIKIDKSETFSVNKKAYLLKSHIVDNQNSPLYISDGKDWGSKTEAFVDNSVILSSYAQHLIPRAIGTSAGVISLFFKEAAEQEVSRVSLPIFQNSLGGLIQQAAGTLVSAVGSVFSNSNNISAGDTAEANQPETLSSGTSNPVVESVVSLPPASIVTPVSAPSVPVSLPAPVLTNTPIVVSHPAVAPSVVPVSGNNNTGGGGAVYIAPKNETVVVVTSTTTSAPTSTEDVVTPSSTVSTSTVPEEAPTSTTIVTSTPEDPVITTSTTSTPEEPVVTTSTTSTVVSTSTTSTDPAVTTSTTPTTTPVTTTVAVATGTVVINEVAWAGTIGYPNYEYIELYNDTDEPVALFPTTGTRWKLEIGGQPISFSTIANRTLPARGYYLLERVSDNTVKAITADAVYSGVLNNNGDNLRLINPLGEVVDQVNCVTTTSGTGWFAGDSVADRYRSMERIDPKVGGSVPSNWRSALGIRIPGRTNNGGPIYGSPRATNHGFVALTGYQADTNTIITSVGNPYVLEAYNIRIGQTLTIEPGVIIKSNSYYSTISVEGKLVVSGTSANPVIMTSGRDDSIGAVFGSYNTASSASPGDWQGLRIRKAATADIAGLDMRYAGKSYFPDGYIYTSSITQPIRVEEGAGLVMRDSLLTNNHGTTIHSDEATLDITGTSFSGGDKAIYHDSKLPFKLSNSVFSNFTNVTGPVSSGYVWPEMQNNTYTDNVLNAPELQSITMDRDINIPPDTELAVQLITIPAGKTLTVSEGVKLGMYTYGQIIVHGNLVVNGTADKRVKIIPDQNSKIWNRIFAGAGSTVMLNHADLENGGMTSVANTAKWGVLVGENASITMNDTRVIRSRNTHGIISLENTDIDITGGAIGYLAQDHVAYDPHIGIYIDGGSLSLNGTDIMNLDIGIYGVSVPSPALRMYNMAGRFINCYDNIMPRSWLPEPEIFAPLMSVMSEAENTSTGTESELVIPVEEAVETVTSSKVSMDLFEDVVVETVPPTIIETIGPSVSSTEAVPEMNTSTLN